MACASTARNGLPMNEIRELSDRIDALEARLTFQDDTIEVLNHTITMQWQTIDTLTRQVSLLNARLREAEAGALRPSNEPPPHY